MPSIDDQIFFTKEEIDHLTDNWSDLEIAKKLNISYAKVRKARVIHNVKTFTQKTGLVRIEKTGELRKKGSVRGVARSDNLDVTYFSSINTPKKAYWLGMLLADGWSTLRNGVPKEIGLACSPKDIHILQEFQKEINHEGKIVIKTNKNSLKKDKISQIATIRVTCQEFTRLAIEAGVKPRKSGKLQIPHFVHSFPAAFCRGFFDGDGSISEKNFTFICGSAGFQKELQAFIRTHTGVTLYPAALISPTTGKPVERLSGYKKDRKVLEWMYAVPDPCLERKYRKFVGSWF
jgi:hypothetical protein